MAIFSSIEMDSKFRSLCDIRADSQRLQQHQSSSQIFNSSKQSKSTDQHLNCQSGQLVEDAATKQVVVVGGGKQESSAMMIKMSKKKQKAKQDEEKPHFRIDWRSLSYFHEQKSWQSRFNIQAKHARADNHLVAQDDIFNCDYGLSRSEKRHANNRKSSAPSKRGRYILNSLDGHFKSGELSAILGPSGAGKSTFLSTLFGSRQEQATGQTRLTWMPSKRQQSNPIEATPAYKYERRPLRVAFLPQQDHLLHHLTVYETLLFASRLKNQTLERTNMANNNQQHQQQINQRSKNETEFAYHVANVRRVARMLKLTECLNTRCGKLSGGQYKRVSIGQELLSQPDVIILDEPTSGLDASTCLSTVRTLKSIVSGKLPISIILTIHQPDSDVFSLFDRIYVIAQGGLAIYEGPPSGIMATLAQVGLEPPHQVYNAARFIVENAFLSEPADDQAFHVANEKSESRVATPSAKRPGRDTPDADKNRDSSSPKCSSSSSSDEEEDDWQMADANNNNAENKLGNLSSVLTKSLLSLKDTLSGRELKFPEANNNNEQKEQYDASKKMTKRKENSRSRPLLAQIGGFKTLGGKLIKAEKVALKRDYEDACDELDDKTKKRSFERDSYDGCAIIDSNRLSILRQLNQIQRSAYYTQTSHSNQSPATSDWPAPVKKAAALSVIVDLDAHSNADSISDGRRKEETCENVLLFNGKSRDFDKRLSAKHNSQHQKSAGILYQASLLAHRTWLSIVRDPIFFGIQAFMHTTIPILLALIFGSHQDEGCPRLGSFDLVEFAYSGQESMSGSKSMISDTVSSIRLTVGNVGIIFFEMFVLMFAINCITALVFPADMFVLLKEYRNGWYSMLSYFMGRSLADLPIPVLLHSLAMIILCLLTKQPLDFWRLSLIILLVVMASLIAQSLGLTVGAILMKNSQSAVLAAAGIVAPFFALSGFIVRIHTLPWAAQFAAKASYLHQLLNGFIILRYGFNRCPCKEEDFDLEPGHQVPQQIHTMASIWVGTFSDEFQSKQNATATNQLADPNIDVVDKIMTSFKAANTFGHQMSSCKDVRPYAMLDFNLHDSDLVSCFVVLLVMIIVSRLITFTAIYYKVRAAT